MNKRTFLNSLLCGVLLVACGCTSHETTAHMVFIDYSSSAATLHPENQELIKERLVSLWDEIMAGDEIIVYPIHLLSETATPLLRTTKPYLNGDLNDRQNADVKKKNFIDKVNNRLFESIEIPPDLRGGTNIYPIIRKVSRHLERGNIRLVLISDMIHEYMDERLHLVLSSHEAPTPNEHARKKCRELDFMNRLNNVSVEILIPGTYLGDVDDEPIRHKIVVFWEEFFTLAGAVPSIMDL